MTVYPAELRDEARRIARDEGLGAKRVGDRLGVSKSTALRWIYPNHAEDSRRLTNEAKRRRVGTCEDCGGETRYNGHTDSGVSRFCVPCGQERAASAARARAGKGPMQQRLYALLTDGPRRFTEIQTALGISHNYTAALLPRERVAGRIVRLRRGVYALPEKP